MVYSVDTNAIEQHLHFFESLQTVTEQLLDKVVPHFPPTMESLALERCVYLYIETVASVGGFIIDGFFMRDPGSYEDFVQILLQEDVFSPEVGRDLLRLVQLRRSIVGEYWKSNLNWDLAGVLREIWTSLCLFPEQVRSYIQRELV